MTHPISSHWPWHRTCLLATVVRAGIVCRRAEAWPPTVLQALAGLHFALTPISQGMARFLEQNRQCTLWDERRLASWGAPLNQVLRTPARNEQGKYMLCRYIHIIMWVVPQLTPSLSEILLYMASNHMHHAVPARFTAKDLASRSPKGKTVARVL